MEKKIKAMSRKRPLSPVGEEERQQKKPKQQTETLASASYLPADVWGNVEPFLTGRELALLSATHPEATARRNKHCLDLTHCARWRQMQEQQQRFPRLEPAAAKQQKQPFVWFQTPPIETTSASIYDESHQPIEQETDDWSDCQAECRMHCAKPLSQLMFDASGGGLEVRFPLSNGFRLVVSASHKRLIDEPEVSASIEVEIESESFDHVSRRVQLPKDVAAYWETATQLVESMAFGNEGIDDDN
jgi:hypothetical protein